MIDLENVSKDKPDYEFDLSQIEQGVLVELRQEGNFVKGITSTGTHFSQRIPQGKILNKVDGKYILQDIVVRDSE